MRKQFSLLTVLVLVGFGLLAGALLNQLISGDNIHEQVGKYGDVLSLTLKYYVDDVDTQKLTESAIQGLVGQLDPHSVYIPSSQLQRVNEEFQGSFEGIGIEYQVLNDTLMVVSPIAGGPSEALGIQAGRQDRQDQRLERRRHQAGGGAEEAARPEGDEGAGSASSGRG